MALTDFDFEFYSDVQAFPDALKEFAEARMRELGETSGDMTGASVAVRQEGKNNAPFSYQARIVAYIKPENMAVNEKADNAEQALREALDAMERKIRKHRDSIRDRARTPRSPDS